MNPTYFMLPTTLSSENSERAARKRQKAQTPNMTNLLFEAAPTLETAQVNQASMKSSADALRDAKGRYEHMFGATRDGILILASDQESIAKVGANLIPS